MSLAIDYAWQHPNPQAIKDAGYDFVLRYLSNDPSKNITAAERDSLWAVGLGILVVWETTATRATEGAQAGVQDAHAANAQADQLGYPATLPIFFAVDEQADWPSVRAYFQGAAQASSRPMRARAYGDNLVCDGAASAGLGTEHWQTEAWSGSAVSSNAALYQRVTPTRSAIAGAQGKYDEDTVLKPIAWWTGSGQVQAPAPIPSPFSEGDEPVAICVDANGRRHIERVSPNGDLLYFTSDDGVHWNVIDVTAEIAQSNTGNPRFTVVPG